MERGQSGVLRRHERLELRTRGHIFEERNEQAKPTRWPSAGNVGKLVTVIPRPHSPG
jgi:hypothetical protein